MDIIYLKIVSYINTIDQMVRRCEDINKLRRLYKRYKEYYDELNHE